MTFALAEVSWHIPRALSVTFNPLVCEQNYFKGCMALVGLQKGGSECKALGPSGQVLGIQLSGRALASHG